MNPTRLIVGTRGSDLALFQANFIKSLLERQPEVVVELKIIKTSGDKIDYLSFDKMEGKGFFTKELEEALLAREIDLAVHSLKDLMTVQPDRLKLGAVGFREDRRELLLVNPDAFTGEGVIPVKRGGVIGTSSARRQCQIAHHNPGLKIKDLRGNVPTRVRKLRDGEYNAILLAAAGVKRLELDLTGLESILLNPEQFLPAPAQGILGVQIRDNDETVERIVARLNSAATAVQAELERGLLRMFELGCSLPLGVYSDRVGDDYRLKAVLGQRTKKGWGEMRRVDIIGDDPAAIVEKAFQGLTTEAE